jgi:hypothetical protein
MLVKPRNLSNGDLFDQARVFETFRLFTRIYKKMLMSWRIKKCWKVWKRLLKICKIQARTMGSKNVISWLFYSSL